MELALLFKAGGLIMYPLLLCSVLIWAIVFEKWWTLFRFKRELRKLIFKLTDLLKNNKMAEAKGLCLHSSENLSAPIMALLEGGTGKQENKDAQVARRLQETQLGLKRYIWILGSIGALAPFIGLFGTVVGIIGSFKSIAAAGKSGFSVVAAGLSEALIATAAGILVAIISVFFYNYFQAQLTKLFLELKNRIADLSDLLP